ncbi:MAG: CPBP family intramembrane metalloprotease [bacterium]|nr:CPBP family intramembrane metalloprotease [bacterium]
MSLSDLYLRVIITKIVVILCSVVLPPTIFLLFLHNTGKINLFLFFNNLMYHQKSLVDFMKLSLVSMLLFIFSIIYFFVVLDYDSIGILVVYVKYSYFWEMIMLFVGLVILVPLAEELIFRKYLIDSLLNIFKPSSVIFFSSLVFSLIHLQDILSTVFIFTIGIILAYIYLTRKDIIYTYILHSFYNFLIMIYWIYLS